MGSAPGVHGSAPLVPRAAPLASLDELPTLDQAAKDSERFLSIETGFVSPESSVRERAVRRHCQGDLIKLRIGVPYTCRYADVTCQKVFRTTAFALSHQDPLAHEALRHRSSLDAVDGEQRSDIAVCDGALSGNRDDLTIADRSSSRPCRISVLIHARSRR